MPIPSSIEESKSVKGRSSKTSAKGAKASKVSKDSDKKTEQSSIDVIQGESEQSSSSFLEVPRGDKVKSGSTSRRTSFNSEASGNESDVSEVNNADVEESWCSVLKKDIKNFIEEKKEKGEDWWIELLGTKVGFDAVAKKWIREEKAKDNSGLLSHKSTLNELVVRLVCEIDISSGTAFEAKRIFVLFESLSDIIEEEQSRRIVELIVQKDKASLLKLICDKETKNKETKNKDGSRVASFGNEAGSQYFWKGKFSGFATIAELLNYAIDQGSPGSARLLVDRVYSTLHPIYNQGQYLDNIYHFSLYSCSVNGKSIKSIKEKEEFFKELLEKVIKKGFADSLLKMLGGDVAQLILKMSKDKFEACNELQDIHNMTKTAVIHVLQSLVQPQDGEKAKERKALIKKLIEKGATVKEEDITAKDLEALAGEHGIPILSRTGKNYIKGKLQENKVDVSKVKRKLSRNIIYGIIVELFFYQHEQIYAIAEDIVENKLIFYDYCKDPINKDKVKESLSDLTQDIEEKVLAVITQLNKAGRAQKNLFSRLVFKEIMLIEPDKGKGSEIKIENVKKIIKACVALHQEPMQELVDELRKKGVTISEEVMNVLKLVGVDPLELEKSMTSVPENSNVVPSRNIPSLQIEDLTLSSNSRSEKGTSDELRQPSADAELTSDDCSSTSHDPLKINITGLERVAKAKVLSPAPPGSKAVEKKDKGFMQSNCGQGENSSYNKGENSHRHSGKVGSISGGLGMFSRVDFKAIDEDKKKELGEESYASGLLGRVGKQVKAHPPSIQELLNADRVMYMEKTLDKVILNYNTLFYDHLRGSSSSDQDLNESFDEEEVLHTLFKSNGNFVKYQDAVNELVNGNVVAAKRELLELVNDKVEPAYYAYVLVFFKETIRQCDVLSATAENVKVMEKSESDINAAVQLLQRASLMEPASSFLLGMMKRYDIGECSKFMGGSWKDDLIHVVNVARERHFFDIEQYILVGIDRNNEWNYEKCGLGMQKKDECVKEMGKYSLYEITLSMMSQQHFNADALNDLFQILSQGEFPEALYSYGAALLKNKVSKNRMFKENVKEAIEYLDRAIVAGHKGAGFLLGVLPFTNKVGRRLPNDEIKRCVHKLEDYISKYGGLCAMNKKNVDKAVYCLAAEYYVKESHLVQQHNKQKAERMLRLRGMFEELDALRSLEESFLLGSSSTISPSFSSEQTFSPAFSSSKIGSSSSGCVATLDDDPKSSSMPKTDLHDISTKGINDSLLTK